MKTNIKELIGQVFTAVWGYNQTNYSHYRVESTKGKQTLIISAIGNEYIGELEMVEGSEILLYDFKRWGLLSDAEKEDLENRGFNRLNYDAHYIKEAQKKGELVTIVKTKRNRSEGTFEWTLSNGQIVTNESFYNNTFSYKKIKPLKQVRVSSKYHNRLHINIDRTITAFLNEDYENNLQMYADQIMHNAYYGH